MEIWGLIRIRGAQARAGRLEETALAGAPFLRIGWITGGEIDREVIVPPSELVQVEPLSETEARRAGRPGASVQEVVQAVAQLTGVPATRIASRCRVQEVATARFLVMRALRNLGLTLSATARALGRDHSAVVHGLDTLSQAAATSQLIRDQIAWVNSRWPTTAVGADGGGK